MTPLFTLEAVKERPILYAGSMVRAIGKGIKTQTRCVFKMPVGMRWDDSSGSGGEAEGFVIDDAGMGYWHLEELACPHGRIGERLWVRESWGYWPFSLDEERNVLYRADVGHDVRTTLQADRVAWRPSIHMPRWACRCVLEITEVRVQRIQEISDEDILAEGVLEYGESLGLKYSPRATWIHLWDAINGSRNSGRYAWAQNPWTWALTFQPVPKEATIGQV